MVLYPHQQKIVDLNPAKHLLAHGTGVGKTITSIALAEKNCGTVLVIVPKALKEMWERETAKHGSKCKYTIITKENFRRDAKVLLRHDGVIVDESHAFASLTSKLSKALMWYNTHHQIQYRWLCTATPVLANPMSVYVLAKHLEYPISYPSFRAQFFTEVRMGVRVVPIPKKGKEKELANLVRKLGSVVDLESAVEQAQASPVEGLPELKAVPEQIFQTEYFDLTKEQQNAIKTLNEPQFISRWTKIHSIEQGILYSDGYTEDQIFPSRKTERILALIPEHTKMAIFARYNKQIDYLKQKIEETYPQVPVFIIRGDVKNRDAVVQQVESAHQAIVLIQSDCAEGYELPSVGFIIFASLSFSYKNYAQAIGRFLRINRLKKNVYLHLVTNGVDKDVHNAIMNKKDFYIELFDGTIDASCQPVTSHETNSSHSSMSGLEQLPF